MNSHFCRVGNITSKSNITLKSKELKKEMLKTTEGSDYNPINTTIRHKH